MNERAAADGRKIQSVIHKIETNRRNLFENATAHRISFYHVEKDMQKGGISLFH